MTSTQDIEFGNELEFENMDSSDTADLSPEFSDSIIDGESEDIEDSASRNRSAENRLADQLARLTADHQNYVRRTEQEKGEMGNYFTEKIAKKILPTIDNLERVLAGTPQELQQGSVFEAVKGAHTGLIKELESLGISSYSSVGKELDPTLHEALSQAPGPIGVIVLEFEKGYFLGKKVIRHAKVIVGNGESEGDTLV